MTTFYGSDFSPSLLKIQLEVLHTYFSEKKGDASSQLSVSEVIKCIQALPESQQTLISEVITLIKLIVVMPATNSTSERSFSALRRIKTYLRSTMSQARLNNLMILHVHRQRTDCLDINVIANDFVCRNKSRLAVFGKFK